VDIEDHLAALRARPVEPAEKGLGPRSGQTPADITADRPYLHAAGLSYPLLTLRESALRANAQAMADFCASHGVSLAPHGKTGMSPELAALQVDHGAWAITVATINELRTYRSFGFTRLLLANELTDEASLRWLAADPDLEAYFYVDSPSFITSLSFSPANPLPVLVDIGYEHGRTGCRTDAEAIEVAKAIAGSAAFRLAGVAGYEGSIHGDDVTARVSEFCGRLRRLADSLRPFGSADEDFIVTAGGSQHFDVVARELTAGDTSGLRIVLRSGAYLYHDHGIYARMTPSARGVADAPVFRPAIELWAQVWSCPEPGLALLGFGRRDAGHDSGLPVPLGVVRPSSAGESSPPGRAGESGPPGSAGESARSRGAGLPGWTIASLDDQHAYLHLPPDAELSPGDIVRMGISHPCTTLDKWRLIPLIDDTGHITNIAHAFW
jgi:D-serine deaminase-like pyridoxal phosphate-dependent protein